jgi:hypothetical protein
MTASPFTAEQKADLVGALASIPEWDLEAARRTVEYVAEGAMRICRSWGDTSIEAWTFALGKLVETATEEDPEIGRKVGTSLLFLAIEEGAKS